MSVPFGRAVLTLDDITQQIRNTFEQFTDPRRGKNTRYTLVDAGLSAFSVCFMQSPSFLEYQRSLDQWLGRNNAQTLFGVHQIPSDNQIRHWLDATDPGQVKPLFSYLFQALNQAGVVETYRSVNQTLLLQQFSFWRFHPVSGCGGAGSKLCSMNVIKASQFSKHR